MRLSGLALGLVGLFLAGSPALGRPVQRVPPPAATRTAQPEDPLSLSLERLAGALSEHRLDNGLRVVLLPLPESPTVSVAVTYDVGSRNETAGQSGFAHLFEHMMFQGSRNLKKGEHFQLVVGRGGQANGTTSNDRTNYFQTLPRNELELALFLEADRMRWLDVSAENFENQKLVVREEYHMRVTNAPYRPGLIQLDASVFGAYTPYARPTIGDLGELERAPLSWVTAFHAVHYTPTNAVLSVVGGFEEPEALELIRRHFSPIPGRRGLRYAPPLVPAHTKDPQPIVLEDKNARTLGTALGFRIPAFRTRAHFALELTASLLGDGEASLLVERLVHERSLAQDVAVWTRDLRDVDVFTIFVEHKPGVEVEPVLQVILDELERLARFGPPAASLERARARLRTSTLFGLESNQNRAILLGHYAVLYGRPGLFVEDFAALMAVTAGDVREAVSAHLQPNLRHLVVMRPSHATLPTKEPS